MNTPCPPPLRVLAPLPATVDDLVTALTQAGYVCDRPLAVSVFLALSLQRPLLLEGEPGVGKTQLAKSLASVLGSQLLRVQCHEGLDIAQTAYEWNVQRQLMRVRLAEASGRIRGEAAEAELESSLYQRDMLIERPLLQALTQPSSPVLLIDELDRADEPFDAFLLELLAENQITVPELGTITAIAPPITVITSNRTREVHDALKRRCLYHWVGFPEPERELEIVRRRAPDAAVNLAAQVVAVVRRVRAMDLLKAPGISETIDWVRALSALSVVCLDPETIEQTLGVLLKHREDIERLRAHDTAGLLRELQDKGWLEQGA